MSLFIDGNLSNIEDLRDYDASILDVSAAEGVELSPKLRLAETEIGIELEEFLRRRTGGASPLTGQSGVGLANVVVTSALKQWHTLHALSLVYSDVRGNHTSSRYPEKWKEFTRKARWAAEMLYRTGVALTSSPVAKAQTPSISTLPGDVPGATYYVRIAWRNKQDESGALSDPVVHSVLVNGLIAVRAWNPPATATGYDVYLGAAEPEVTKQNEAPVSPGEEWVLPISGMVTGAPPPALQQAQWFLRNDRVIQRG